MFKNITVKLKLTDFALKYKIKYKYIYLYIFLR